MTDPLDSLQRLVTRRGTKAEVEAEDGGSLEEVRFAYATDTDELGVCTAGVWTWIPVSAAPTFGTPAIVLGTAAAAGAIDEVIRRDATIVAFDATAPVTQAFGDTAAAGSAAVAARRDHRHGMPSTVSAASVRDAGRWEPVVDDGTDTLIFDAHTVVMDWTTS